MDGSANGAKDEYEEGEYVDDDVTNDSVQQERSYESKRESSSPPVRSRPAAEKRRELPFGVSRHYADDSQQQRPRAKSRERDKERQSRKHKRKNKDKSKSRSRLSPVCMLANLCKYCRCILPHRLQGVLLLFLCYLLIFDVDYTCAIFFSW